MEGQHLVLRLRASSGHSRVTCNSSITASELYVQVAQQLKVPEDTLDLYTDAAKKQLLPRAACCVESLGLSSGCLLFVDTRGSNAVVRHSATLFTPSHSLKDVALDIPPAEGRLATSCGSCAFLWAAALCPGLPTASSSSSSSNLSSSSSSSKDADSSGNNSAFKPFDKFLEERDYAVLDLPLVNSFTATKLQAGHMNKLPQTLTLKHQVYRHVDHLELMNVSEVQQFVSYWKNDLNMQQQRCGFMFGYYREDRHYPLGIRAVCEAVYEPPQEGTEDEFRLLEGHASEMELAAAVAARLGLELIGFVFTHKPRKQLLTPKEVLFLAKLQLAHLQSSHFSGYPVPKFVACTVALQHTAEPQELEQQEQKQQEQKQQEIVPNAFMVSDLIMALVRDGMIADEQTDETHIVLSKPRKGELRPQVLESGVEKDRFDASWCIVRVNESAPKRVRSFFQHTHFPRENRIIAQTPQDIQAYFNHPSMSRSAAGAAGGSDANWSRFCDFHLLLYVARLFDLPTSLTICDSVSKETPVDAGMEDILKSLA
ncbi:nuclear protein localization protein 4 [Cyclospora cayetanensis]|uniref:Nuclear protein localization protein 4 n=1 Tax=Cyclospora cayetanensis TaxID=88456 RepID=A0A6P6RSP1_9EIME|nr:nuclear protein localization protein 4 [Cyclospora cayetanensis]